MNADTRGLGVDTDQVIADEPQVVRLAFCSTKAAELHGYAYIVIFCVLSCLVFLPVLSIDTKEAGNGSALTVYVVVILFLCSSFWTAIVSGTRAINPVLTIERPMHSIRVNGIGLSADCRAARVKHIEIGLNEQGRPFRVLIHRVSTSPIRLSGLADPVSAAHTIAAQLPESCAIKTIPACREWSPWWTTLFAGAMIPFVVWLMVR